MGVSDESPAPSERNHEQFNAAIRVCFFVWHISVIDEAARVQRSNRLLAKQAAAH